MTTTALPTPTGSIKPAPATTSPTATPTIDQSIHVDIGSALATLFRNSEKLAESLVNLGVSTALHAVPFGSVIVGYALPVIDQYVESAFSMLESALQTETFTVPAGNVVLAAAAKAFNKNEAALSAFLGDALPGMIQTAVGKLGLQVALPNATAQ